MMYQKHVYKLRQKPKAVYWRTLCEVSVTQRGHVHCHGAEINPLIRVGTWTSPLRPLPLVLYQWVNKGPDQWPAQKLTAKKWEGSETDPPAQMGRKNKMPWELAPSPFLLDFTVLQPTSLSSFAECTMTCNALCARIWADTSCKHGCWSTASSTITALDYIKCPLFSV